jgi:hypothetical protein
MSVPAPRQPRHGSTRWEIIRDAIGSNAKTARLCLIWLVMTGAPVTALAELIRHIRLRANGLSYGGPQRMFCRPSGHGIGAKSSADRGRPEAMQH